jgi:DNA-binding NtrC family response regulator
MREKRTRVLVVEDEPELLRLVKTILEEAGLEVTGVSREGEAIRQLRAERYAVVVTDLYVTRGQEGVESVGALLEAAGATPVVVMTGWPVEGEVAEAAGVVSVLRKPFELEEVVRAVEGALGRGGVWRGYEADPAERQGAGV